MDRIIMCSELRVGTDFKTYSMNRIDIDVYLGFVILYEINISPDITRDDG